MNASTSTLSSIPPPLPPKHQRRLSLSSLTSTIRRSTSVSSSPGPSNKLPPYSRWSAKPDLEKARKRPTSLFSWRSKRTSCVTLDPLGSDEKRLDTGGGGDEYPIVSDRKGRRIRTNLPPVPRLVIDVDSSPSYISAYYSLTPRTAQRADSNAPPSLPEFRRSTFQPLDLHSTTTPSSSAAGVFDLPPSPRSSPFRTPPSKNSSPPSNPPLRRLEPRSPRIDARPRSVATLPPANCRPRTPVNTPAPPMIRSTSFTLSLPTVAEVVPNPSPSRHKLRPIVIAPRKSSLSSASPSSSSPSLPSTPRSGYFSSRSGSFSSTQTHVDLPETSRNVTSEEGSSFREKVDWSEIERTLRDLSEERLQILLEEVRRAKA